MQRPAWAPTGIDISVPSVSRIYDYYLGGSHNFEVDREAARKAMEFMPGLPKIMQANRAFMRRAVRYAVDQGIEQFLDIGSGIPTFGNVHEVAQKAAPGARVVYVDHDPVAVAHGEAVLADNPHAQSVAADFLRPREILQSPPVKELLDLDRPVAVLLIALLHFIDEDDNPHQVLAELVGALAPGSLIVLTHAAPELMPGRAETEGVAGVYEAIRSPLWLRPKEEVARFFDGLELVEPGLVPIPHWRPEAATPEEEDPQSLAPGYAAVGRTA
ncbi:SAM-dependent methyltransferase [Streptomyces sp. NA04227]|uniref:SAM-dependent methyltransferase n=1 Tax=Streptomyces sp. NA04227 TaxID=2742136 RepID=UPI001591C2DF|nr:SAM-dependent methyltransferase [Streptomyces sp. NA04227]QKW10328.1 SAM-dependent methyltransferase [Streptomyces sp. NA04227]